MSDRAVFADEFSAWLAGCWPLYFLVNAALTAALMVAVFPLAVLSTTMRLLRRS